MQTIQQTLTATAISKAIAAMITYPCQNVRACQQASATKGIRAADIVRREGVRGLYRGLVPYLMHVMPNACLVFAVYELVVNSCKNH